MAGIRSVRARGPLPTAIEYLCQWRTDAARCARFSDGDFPFRFGRQSSSRPAGIRIGFIETHVAYGSVRIDRPHSGQRELLPTVADALPIERRGPAFFVLDGPAVGEPKLRS